MVSAGSRIEAPSTAPASSACCVASMPMATISACAVSAFTTCQSQCWSVVFGTEPGGCVASRAGRPVASRNLRKASALSAVPEKYGPSFGPATNTISSTAVAATTRTSMFFVRATASGAMPAT